MNNLPNKDVLPYWMQGLTDDERETLAIATRKAVFEGLDSSFESKLILLVSRIAGLFNESEEIESVDAVEGDPYTFFDDDEEDEDCDGI